MKKADVYEIAVKLFGVYLIIPVIYSLGNIFNIVLTEFNARGSGQQFEVNVFWAAVVMLMILLGTSLFLMLKTKAVVGMITTQSDITDDVKLFASKKTIYEIALFLIGGIMFLWSLPDICFSIYNYIDYTKRGMHWSPNQAQLLTMQALKLIVGVFILLSAELLSNVFSKENTVQSV